MAQDYVGSCKSANELLHYGVKGMKWGVRRPRGTASTSSPKSGGSSSGSGAKTDHVGKAKSGASAKAPVKKAPENETSVERYARLKKEVALGKASKLDDDDLKFLNARADALRKANAAFNNKESWLANSVKTAMQDAVNNQLKAVTNLALQQYLGNKVADKIKTDAAKRTAKSAAKGAFKVNTSKVVMRPTPIFRVTNL